MNNFERISTLIKKENIKNIALLSVDVKGKIHLLTPCFLGKNRASKRNIF